MTVLLIVVGIYLAGVLAALGYWCVKAGVDYVFEPELLPTFVWLSLRWPALLLDRYAR